MSRKLFALAKTPVGDLIVGLAFGKLSRLLPVKRVLETDRVVAFWHPKPFWEKHILIVPKKAISKITTLSSDDLVYVSEVYMAARKIVVDLGWESQGYTLLTNGGSRQEVNQLHFHLAAGNNL